MYHQRRKRGFHNEVAAEDLSSCMKNAEPGSPGKYGDALVVLGIIAGRCDHRGKTLLMVGLLYDARSGDHEFRGWVPWTTLWIALNYPY